MTRAFLSLITSFVLLIIIGCTPGSTPLPQPDQPEGEAQAVAETATPQPEAPTSTPVPSPTPEPEPMPPLVVRSSPERGEEQPVDAPIEILFDQPMDRNSVEKAFAIEPGASVDGAFDWPDDQTVRFALNNGFQRGERYKVRVIESARSAAGLELQRPFELQFSTVGFLEVTDVQPAEGATEILPNTVVTVAFNPPGVTRNSLVYAGTKPDPHT